MRLQISSSLRLSARLGCGLLVSCLLLSRSVAATEAGWRPYAVPPSELNAEPIKVALFYPTQAQATKTPMGPFTVTAAIGAPSDGRVKGLIILSHGTGGSELAHNSVAEALARSGYLVAALRHPGDNYADRSMWQRGPDAFFQERPRQASAVINALLGDPGWKNRIATDAKGPRIGALGHSAGGFTVVALAGGQSDLSRIGAHCGSESADDPLFCSMSPKDRPVPATFLIPPTADKRVRAIVAMAPMGAVFTASSLATIDIPTWIYAAADDRWLVPRFHAEWIARNVPGARFSTVANAWHFAFLDPPATPIPTLDGDAAADPVGFDRSAFLAKLSGELTAFFDNAFEAGQ